MAKIVFLRGLPASGKSTYAKKLADSGYTRVNKDELRAMMHNGHWSKQNEKEVLDVQLEILKRALFMGKSVVIDNTNFAEKHYVEAQTLAKTYKATLETKFFDVDLDECIKRDLARANSVGEKVIRKMYKQYIKPNPPEYRPSAPRRAIIVDIDGTLAHMAGRSPYDYSHDAIMSDTLDETVANLVAEMGKAAAIVIVSGRKDECLESTKEWLEKHNVQYNEIHMRKTDDNRSDAIIKKEIFEEFIRPRYNVEFVLDDRDRVVDMWRNELGLKVLQVAEGDF